MRRDLRELLRVERYIGSGDGRPRGAARCFGRDDGAAGRGGGFFLDSRLRAEDHLEGFDVKKQIPLYTGHILTIVADGGCR